MKTLIEYINAHSIRGACTCQYCHDESTNPVQIQLQPSTGHQAHTVDLIFFKVTPNPDSPPNARDLRNLIVSSNKAADLKLDLFDGAEHDYFTVGKWIGDQAAGLTLMGLGHLLRLWNLQTPESVHPEVVFPRTTMLSLAEAGCISITST